MDCRLSRRRLAGAALTSVVALGSAGCGSDAKRTDAPLPATAGGNGGGHAGNSASGGVSAQSGAGGQGGAGAATGGAAGGVGAGGNAAAAGTGSGGGGTGGAAGAATSGVGGALAQGGAAGAGTPSGAGGQAGAAGNPNTPRVPKNTYDGARPTTVSFDAAWKFHLGAADGADKVSFDDSSWTTLDVPHDWSITLPFNQTSLAGAGGGYLDGGLGWYRKSFELPSTSAGKHVFLQFDGVYMDSTVWVNGTQVCARPYGYSSFECDISSVAKADSSNVVAVKVNNQLPSSRWYSGSGIYRHAWLKTVDAVHVGYTGASVVTSDVTNASAKVNVTVAVQNDAAGEQAVTVGFSLRDPAGKEVATATSEATTVAAGKAASVKQTLTVTNPSIWSLTTPVLYSLVTTVTAGGAPLDTYTTPFGIRTFAFDAATGFSLNGVKTKLNGVCLHHDLGALGAAVNERAIEKRLEMLKEMGVNAIRTSHNPPAPELLDIADRLGFLVMDEAFDCWYNGKNQYDYGRFFKQWSNRDIEDMVARDLNHPGIIIWSIANEVGETSDTAVIQQLIDAVKTKDVTRPIGQALAAWASADTPGVALEDVVGINYAPDRYDSIHSAHPTWKMFASESSSALRSRGIYDNKNTQCSSYDDNAAGWGATAEASWKNVNTRAWIAGEFIWTGFDYIGEPTPYEWPAKSSYFGAIDTAYLPKDIFYFYQSKWNAAGPPMVHLVPMNWTNFSNGQKVKVMAYTNAESVELFLNGTSLGSKEMTSTTGHLEWSVTFAAGTLEAKASKAGAVVANDKLQTAGAAAALVLKVDRPAIAADGRDLAFIEVDVVDAQGVLVPEAANKIDFALSGPGTLAGVDNGDATSHEPYQGSSRSAFSGKAMAIVKSTTAPGAITLTASSGSLTVASATITTTAP